MRTVVLVGDGFPGVVEDPGEELPVPGLEAVGLVAFETPGEGRVRVEVVADVGPATLHHVLREPAAEPPAVVGGGVGGEVGELRVEELDEGAERRLLAAVRGGGDEDEVPLRVGGETGDEVVALVTSLALCPPGGGVGLVHDHQLRARPQELVATAVGLDEVHRHDDVRVDVEERLVQGAAPLQPGGGGREHDLGVDLELLGEFALPLLCQVRGAEDGEAGGVALVEELPGDQPGLQGLADADVVGDEQADRVEAERHEQGDELVGPGLDGDAGEGAERARPGAEPETERVAQEGAGAVVAHEVRVGESEAGRRHRFKRRPDPGDLVVGAPEGPEHEEVVVGVGEHDPLAAAGPHEGSHPEAHDPVPKISG